MAKKIYIVDLAACRREIQCSLFGLFLRSK